MVTLLSFLVFSTFLLGGINFSNGEEKFLGLFTAVVLLGFAFLKKRKLSLPKGIVFYEITIVLLIVYQLLGKISVYSSDYIILFLTGGIYWVVFYNLQEYKKSVEYLVYILAAIFTFMNFYNFHFHPTDYYYWSLAYRSTSNHNNIGDYWVFIALASLFHLVQKFRKSFLAIFFFSIFVLFISQSRSALLAMLVGALFMLNRGLNKKKLLKVARKYLYLLFVIFAIIFVYQGIFKITLNSRVYFAQALYSIYKNPWGIGIGNFGIVSQQLSRLVPGVDSYSLFTHNIILELAVGLGMLSVFFVAWLILVLINLLKERKSDLFFTTLFIGMTVIFFFDAVYFIPAMWWLWFCFLGLAQVNTLKK